VKILKTNHLLTTVYDIKVRVGEKKAKTKTKQTKRAKRKRKRNKPVFRTTQLQLEIQRWNLLPM